MNVHYTKTLLYAYPHVEAVMAQIDDLVLRKALSSISDYSPCEEQCEKIIALTNQKDTLIQLKITMEEKVLAKVTEYEMNCLEYKYFKRQPKEYFAGFDAESRGYFRKQVALANKLSKQMEKVGLDDKWFEKNCLSTSFFTELLKRVISSERKRKKNTNKSSKSQKVHNTQPQSQIKLSA